MPHSHSEGSILEIYPSALLLCIVAVSLELLIEEEFNTWAFLNGERLVKALVRLLASSSAASRDRWKSVSG